MAERPAEVADPPRRSPNGAYLIDLPKPATAAERIDARLVISLVVVSLVSVGFESLFIRQGINLMDEGWPLHAAMELHGAL